MTAHATGRLRRLAGALGAAGLAAATVTGLGIAAAAPAFAGCTSEAITVVTVHKVDPAAGTPLAGAVFRATAGNAGMLLRPLSAAALTAWDGVVDAGLAATGNGSVALAGAEAAARADTPTATMGSTALLTTDASGDAHLLVEQLCGYSPASAVVTLTETVAPLGYLPEPGPVVLRVLRPQVPVVDRIGVVSAPTGVAVTGVAENLVAGPADEPDETSSYGHGTVTVPDVSISVLGTSESITPAQIVVLPTSETVTPPPTVEPAHHGLAYTGVDVAGMGVVAVVLLGGGGILVVSARRRRSRGH